MTMAFRCFDIMFPFSKELALGRSGNSPICEVPKNENGSPKKGCNVKLVQRSENLISLKNFLLLK